MVEKFGNEFINLIKFILEIYRKQISKNIILIFKNK